MNLNRRTVVIANLAMLVAIVASVWTISPTRNAPLNGVLAAAIPIALLIGFNVYVWQRDKIPEGAMLIGQIFFALGNVTLAMVVLGLALPEKAPLLNHVTLDLSIFFVFAITYGLAWGIMFGLWRKTKTDES